MEILAALILSCLCFIFGGTGLGSNDKESYFGAKRIDSITKNVAIDYPNEKM